MTLWRVCVCYSRTIKKEKKKKERDIYLFLYLRKDYNREEEQERNINIRKKTDFPHQTKKDLGHQTEFSTLKVNMLDLERKFTLLPI